MNCSLKLCAPAQSTLVSPPEMKHHLDLVYICLKTEQIEQFKELVNSKHIINLDRVIVLLGVKGNLNSLVKGSFIIPNPEFPGKSEIVTRQVCPGVCRVSVCGCSQDVLLTIHSIYSNKA